MPSNADRAKHIPIPGPLIEWELQTWALPQLWAEVNETIFYHIIRHSSALQPLSAYAAHIDALLQLINPLLERLCLKTCLFCPDPCCVRAKIWYDCRDLLFLHLTRQPLPMGQPLAQGRHSCRFLGSRGCTLPRRLRPWTCTHYLCPTQKERLRRLAPARLQFFETVVDKIRWHRQGLITAFDRVQ